MNKQNTTQNLSFLVSIEKIIRSIPIIYIIFRSIVRFTNYFENDFFYLKKIFKNQKLILLMSALQMEFQHYFFYEILIPKKYTVMNHKKFSFKN